MAKQEQSNDAKQAEEQQAALERGELRAWYFPDDDISVLAADRESAQKERDQRVKALADIRKAKEDQDEEQA